MLAPKQERLLSALRTQLKSLAKAGILSPDQIRELDKLKQLHAESEAILSSTVPKLQAAFEEEAPDAFPEPVTDANPKVAPLSDCRREIGLHPDCLLNSNGLLPGMDDTAHEPPSADMSSWDMASMSFGLDPSGGLEQLPSLFQIVTPPTDSDGIISFIQREQNERCPQCKRKLERTKLGLGSYKARWCHESNCFCCEACNNGMCRTILPSYAVLRWDFEPKVVRQAYGSEAEMSYQRPSLCPGAENPRLFDQVPLLQDIRRLRFQLSKLFDIGAVCEDFVSALETEPERPVLGGGGGAAAASSSSSGPNNDSLGQPPQQTRGANRASFFVSERQRYLVHESEMWSLADLEMIFTSAPNKVVPQGTTVPFAAFLQRIRDAMIRHVLTECDKCKLNAAHVCLACGVEPAIYSFDVRNVFECTRCHAVFHRRCWESVQKAEETCPGCELVSSEQRKKREGPKNNDGGGAVALGKKKKKKKQK